MAAMTCEEKIGQLVMVAASDTVTGPVLAGDATGGIRAGRIGSMLNLWGGARAHAAQRTAVEESRLGVPLLLGLDVVHGHRTIFPIPLAEASAFDPSLWERTARAAAVEAAHDGVAMTFAPMIDVARDPRWGRVAEGPGEAFREAIFLLRTASSRRRNISAPMARRSRGGITPPPTYPSAACMKSICRRSRPPSRPDARPSCPRSTTSPAYL
jgi:hypothetical protein